jgi:hypothetical protein
MTCRMNRIIFIPPERSVQFRIEEKKLSYLEWREEMERRYDVMPMRYWREAETMYKEYKNETDD